jgi:hypothetical protein
MAKKKVAKKTVAKKKAARPAKKSAAKKKRPAKKVAAKRSVKKASRPKRPVKKAARPKASKKRAATRPRKPLKPNQYVEKLAVTVEGPDKSGDLVATESLGGAALVHHTIHPGAETTAIPGQSYRDLKQLGEGPHEIEVVRTLPPSTGAGN